jgi:AraC-like DNA-binding protein
MIPPKNHLPPGRTFKISRFKERIKKTRPHTHDGYYELIFIREGEGFHQVETETYPVAVPELYLLKPGQLHCWQFTAIPKGFVVLFREDFFDPVSESPILALLHSLAETSRVSLQGEPDPLFAFEQMLAAYEQGDAFAPDQIKGQLRALFAWISRLASVQGPSPQAPAPLHEKFLQLLRSQRPPQHRVHEFAMQLHTTPQNLNAACRRYTGQSASELIAHQLLLEAKRYLLHTDLPVGEIAELLRFNDASYFVKFFKKGIGTTPKQFRLAHFQ